MPLANLYPSSKSLFGWKKEEEGLNNFSGCWIGYCLNASNSEYAITDGIIKPNGFVADHYHKCVDQTFHIIEAELERKLETKVSQ